MRLVIFAALAIICFLAADYLFLDARTMRAGWDQAVNQPNLACNFDNECELKRLGAPGDCGECACVAKSWEYQPFPMTELFLFAPQEAYASDCDPGCSSSSIEPCKCDNYQCREATSD